MEVNLTPKDDATTITIVQFTTSEAEDVEYRRDAIQAIHALKKYDSTVYLRIHLDEENSEVQHFYDYVGEIESTPIFISVSDGKLLKRFDGVPTFEDIVALAS